MVQLIIYNVKCTYIGNISTRCCRKCKYYAILNRPSPNSQLNHRPLPLTTYPIPLFANNRQSSNFSSTMHIPRLPVTGNKFPTKYVRPNKAQTCTSNGRTITRQEINHSAMYLKYSTRDDLKTKTRRRLEDVLRHFILL